MKRNRCPKCKSKKYSQAMSFNWTYIKPFESYCSKCKIHFDWDGKEIKRE